MSATWITDLRCAQPEAAWTDADDHIDHHPAAQPAGGWRTIAYCADEIAGHCLQTSLADSAVLSIALPVHGWHAISLGMAGHYDQAVLDVRLGGGRWHTVRAGGGPVQNVPWLIADLHGQALQVRYPRDLSQLSGRLRGQVLAARLFWVHLQPLDADQVAAMEQAQSHPLVYMNDGHSLFYWDVDEQEAIGPELVTRSVARFAGSEWQTLCFCNGGADLVNYPSRVGTLFGDGGWDLPRATDRKVHRVLQGLIDAGHDTLRLALDTAATQGHRRWFYIRPQAWVGEPPFDHAFRSRFFSEHPQWRCRGRDGRPLGKMSIAFPEVRQQLNAILEEGLQRGAEGLAIALVRALPLAWYEQPVLERLAGQGVASDSPPAPDDPRLLSVWGEFFETWLIEIRALLERYRPADAAPYPLVLIGGANLAWHSRFGIDLRALAQQGRFDVFMAYPAGSEDGLIDVSGLAEGFAGTAVQLLPGLGDWRDQGMPLGEIRRRAHAYYRAGAHGLCRWDTSGLLIGTGLDRPQLQALWVEQLMAEADRPLNEFAGLDLDEWPALDGF